MHHKLQNKAPIFFILHIADYDNIFNPDNLEINNEAYNNPGVMVSSIFDINILGYLKRSSSLRMGHP